MGKLRVEDDEGLQEWGRYLTGQRVEKHLPGEHDQDTHGTRHERSADQQKTLKMLQSYMSAMVEMRGAKKPKGWRFNSVEELLLKHGQTFSNDPYTSDEEEVILRLAATLGPCHEKECYLTALRGALEADMTSMEIHYAEGLAMAKGLPLPINHAFLVLNNKPVDLTWRRDYSVGHGYRSAKRLLERAKENLEDDVYIGIKIPTDHIRRQAFDTGQAAPILDDWERGYPLLQRGIPKSWEKLQKALSPFTHEHDEYPRHSINKTHYDTNDNITDVDKHLPGKHDQATHAGVESVKHDLDEATDKDLEGWLKFIGRRGRQNDKDASIDEAVSISLMQSALREHPDRTWVLRDPSGKAQAFAALSKPDPKGWSELQYGAAPWHTVAEGVHGYGLQVVREAVQAAIDGKRCKAIWAEPVNDRSWHILEQAGFEGGREGEPPGGYMVSMNLRPFLSKAEPIKHFTHEHEGWPRHPINVKNHAKYFTKHPELHGPFPKVPKPSPPRASSPSLYALAGKTPPREEIDAEQSFSEAGLRGGIWLERTTVVECKPGMLPEVEGLSDVRLIHKTFTGESVTEYTVYKLFELLRPGFCPTVMIDEKGEGHTMRWVDDAGFGGNAIVLEKDTTTRSHGFSIEQAEDAGFMQVVDWLAGNPDRHTGNVVLDGDRLWPIDNGLCNLSYGQYRFSVNWTWTSRLEPGDAKSRRAFRDSALRTLNQVAENADKIIEVIATKGGLPQRQEPGAFAHGPAVRPKPKFVVSAVKAARKELRAWYKQAEDNANERRRRMA